MKMDVESKGNGGDVYCSKGGHVDDVDGCRRLVKMMGFW